VSWRNRPTDWWRRRRWTAPRIKRVAYYENRSDVPESVERQTLAVAGSRTRPKWAVFECPCGRGHQLVMSLSPEHWPAWRLEEHQDGPTLAPSIDSHRPHRCHFWLRQGRVTWVPEEHLVTVSSRLGAE
jgi:Family of unknown function (DUF6527)